MEIKGNFVRLYVLIEEEYISGFDENGSFRYRTFKVGWVQSPRAFSTNQSRFSMKRALYSEKGLGGLEYGTPTQRTKCIETPSFHMLFYSKGF